MFVNYEHKLGPILAAGVGEQDLKTKGSSWWGRGVQALDPLQEVSVCSTVFLATF